MKLNPMMFLNLRVIFGLFLSVTFIYFAYEARSFPRLAKIFPLSFSIFMSGMSVIYLFKELWDFSKKEEVKTQKYSNAEMSYEGLAIVDVWKRFIYLMGMLLVLYLFFWVFGYVAAIFIMIVLFYRFVNKTHLGWSVFAGICGILLIYILGKVLSLQWPQGLWNIL